MRTYGKLKLIVFNILKYMVVFLVRRRVHISIITQLFCSSWSQEKSLSDVFYEPHKYKALESMECNMVDVKPDGDNNVGSIVSFTRCLVEEPSCSVVRIKEFSKETTANHL